MSPVLSSYHPLGQPLCPLNLTSTYLTNCSQMCACTMLSQAHELVVQAPHVMFDIPQIQLGSEKDVCDCI